MSHQTLNSKIVNVFLDDEQNPITGCIHLEGELQYEIRPASPGTPDTPGTCEEYHAINFELAKIDGGDLSHLSEEAIEELNLLAVQEVNDWEWDEQKEVLGDSGDFYED